MFSFIVRVWHPTVTHSSKHLKANGFEVKKFITNCRNNILQHFMTVITCGRYLNQKYSHETFFNDPYVFGSRTVCSPNEQVGWVWRRWVCISKPASFCTRICSRNGEGEGRASWYVKTFYPFLGTLLSVTSYFKDCILLSRLGSLLLRLLFPAIFFNWETHKCLWPVP